MYIIYTISLLPIQYDKKLLVHLKYIKYLKSNHISTAMRVRTIKTSGLFSILCVIENTNLQYEYKFYYIRMF